LLTLLPIEVLSKITAAAYAFVYPSLYEDFALNPLQAMRCEVPVVAGNAGALPELCGDAALYADCLHFEDLAEKMMLLFKDENKVKELVAAGRIRSLQFSWDKAADSLWQNILKVAND
jgi:glycosyltransferase involved in cell wall biosynthesis